jgi:TetR/AcrR family transcriptional repressor of uid operon
VSKRTQPSQRLSAQVPARTGAKAEAKRACILEAARRCFSERGFHGAGMAAIAETAGISQGLIYRYFASKAEIIREITEAQREGRNEVLARLSSCGELLDLLIEAIDARRRGSAAQVEFDPALFLEVSAEATRDADIAATVSSQEQEMQADFAALVARSAAARGTTLDARELQRRTMLLRCLLDGLVVYALRDPAADRAELRAALHDGLAALGL